MKLQREGYHVYDKGGKPMYLCEWCRSVHELSDLRYETKIGFMCEQCIAAVESHGETLVFETVSTDTK